MNSNFGLSIKFKNIQLTPFEINLSEWNNFDLKITIDSPIPI